MLGFYIYKYSLYSIIYLGIILCAIVYGKYVETLFVFICFLSLRYCFPKTFHCPIVYNCVFWSIEIFWIAVPNTLPITISIFSSVIIGFLMTYILYLIQDYFDLKIKSEKDIKNISLSELNKLLENSLLKNEEKFAIKYYLIDGLKGQQFYNKMGYSKRQCLRIYKSAINKINNLIKSK